MSAKIAKLSPARRQAALALAIAVACQAAGAILRGPPSDPDVEFGSTALWGTFLEFVAFSLALLAWGGVLARAAIREKMSPFGWLWARAAFGTGALALASFGMAAFGLYGGSGAVMLRLLLTFGLGLDAATVGSASVSKKTAVSEALGGAIARVGGLALSAVILTFVLKASLPHGLSDPLRYHLVAPRVWFEAGRMVLPPRVPLLAQASYWDALYGLGTLLLGGTGGRGLIEAQLFAQWTHALFGVGGTALALYVLLESKSRRPEWRVAAVAAALGYASLRATAWIADNDWGVALWAISGAVLLNGLSGSSLALCGGLFIGLAIGGKSTAGFFCAGSLLIFAWRRRPVASLGVVVGAIVLAGTPVWVRNAIWTGNPVFPSLNAVFKSALLSETWSEHQAFYEAAPVDLDFHALAFKVKNLVGESPWVLALAGLPLAEASLRSLGWSTLLALALFVLKVKTGLGDWLRLFGAGLLVLSATAVLSLEAILVRATASAALPRKKRLTALLPWGAAIAIGLSILRMEAPWRSWLDVWSFASPTSALREVHIGGDSKAWLRLNAAKNDLVISTGDNQIYYLSPLAVAVIPEDPRLDAETREQKDPAAIIRSLKATGARYLLDSRHWSGRSWSASATVLAPWLDAHPSAKVYAGRDSTVYDLGRL